jgi:hypothetical protein
MIDVTFSLPVLSVLNPYFVAFRSSIRSLEIPPPVLDATGSVRNRRVRPDADATYDVPSASPVNVSDPVAPTAAVVTAEPVAVPNESVRNADTVVPDGHTSAALAKVNVVAMISPYSTGWP